MTIDTHHGTPVQNQFGRWEIGVGSNFIISLRADLSAKVTFHSSTITKRQFYVF